MVNGQVTLGDQIMGLPTANYTSGTYRGFGSSLFNAENIALEDWMRAEQSANNQAMRELALQESANAFTAQQNDLAWQRNLEASSTYYQRTVDDMKKAGLNPILAINGLSGPNTPTASAGSGSTARSSGSNYHVSSNNVDSQVIGALLQVGAGLLTKGVGGSMSQTFNSNGELIKTVISKK